MNKEGIIKILKEKKFPEERFKSLADDIHKFNIFLIRNFKGVSALNAGMKEVKYYSSFLEKKRKNKRMHYISLKDFAYYVQNSELYNAISELINSGKFLKKY